MLPPPPAPQNLGSGLSGIHRTSLNVCPALAGRLVVTVHGTGLKPNPA